MTHRRLSGEPDLPAAFSAWWFLNGGNIHGQWKRRDYRGIRDAAMTLPKLAWEAANRVWMDHIAALESELAAVKAELAFYKSRQENTARERDLFIRWASLWKRAAKEHLCEFRKRQKNSEETYEVLRGGWIQERDQALSRVRELEESFSKILNRPICNCLHGCGCQTIPYDVIEIARKALGGGK